MESKCCHSLRPIVGYLLCCASQNSAIYLKLDLGKPLSSVGLNFLICKVRIGLLLLLLGLTCRGSRCSSNLSSEAKELEGM